MEERLTFIMKAKNLSMTKFADEIDVQRSSMSHVMNGRNKASLDFIRRILKRYPDINPDWLLFGKGSMNRSDGQMSIDSEGVDHEAMEMLEQENKALQHKAAELEEKLAEAEKKPIEESKVRDEDTIGYRSKEKRIVRIVTFFHDNTFREYKPE